MKKQDADPPLIVLDLQNGFAYIKMRATVLWRQEHIDYASIE